MFKNLIILLGLSIALIGSVRVCGAQEQAELQVVESMIVTATRSQEQGISIPAAISVITQADIIASGAQHLADVLRSQGGIQITDNFGDGSRASIGMRGFGESANANTLILVDGRRLNNSDIGNPDINSISLKDIERIEIVQGSAAVLYGDQAVGGVINIITQEPSDLFADVQLRFGDYDDQDIRANVGARLDNGFVFRFSSQLRDAENYRQHNAVDYRNGLIYAGYHFKKGQIYLESQHVRDEIETPGALFLSEMLADRTQSISAFENDYSLTETDIARLGLELSLNDHWSFMAEYTSRESDGEFLLSFRSFPGSVSTLDRALETFNPRLQGRYTTARGDFLLTLGYDQESSEYELVSVLGRSANEQETSSLYVQSILPIISKVSLSLGLRSADLDNDMSSSFSYPDGINVEDSQSVIEIGLEVRANDHLRHFIRFAENYRFAKIDENTSIFPQPGTVVLDTQAGTSSEIGVEWRKGRRSVKAVFYRLDLDEEIIYDPLSFQNINIDKTLRQGFIWESSARFESGFGILWNYTYTDAEVKSGIYDGNQVPFVAEHISKLGIDYQFSEAWRVYWETHYIGERYFSGDFGNDFEQMPSHATSNIKLSYTMENWQFSAGVRNLFEKEYVEFGSIGFNPSTFLNEPSYFPSPDRHVWLAIRYHMD